MLRGERIVSKKKTIAIGIGWLLCYPTIYFLTIHYSDIYRSLLSFDYLIFLIVGAAIAFFPLEISGKHLFLINTISMATFLVYGLFAEMLLTNIGVIVAMLRMKIGQDQYWRYAQNTISYQIQSLLAGITFYLVNPYLSKVEFYEVNLIAAFLYLVVFLVANQLLLSISNKLLINKSYKPFGKSFWFSMSASVYTIPTAILIVFLYDTFFIVGVIIIGLTMVTVSLSFHYYYKSKKYQKYLSDAYIMNQHLNGHRARATLIDSFMEQLPDLFDIDRVVAYEITKKNEVRQIREMTGEDKEKISHMKDTITLNEQSILWQAWKSEEMIVHQKAEQWIPELEGMIDFKAQSVIVLPTRRENRITGLFLIMNRLKHAFGPEEVAVSRVLHSYFMVALENASYIEEMQQKSETDHLTKLPNLGGLEEILNNFETHSFDLNCSLVVLDLDHFKEVNDTYGHEAGNELLVKIAKVLNDFVGKKGTIARYGGEEFVFFLPGYTAEVAKEIAESTRNHLEKQEFTVTNHIAEQTERVSIKITGSFGVANHPDHVDSIKELISFADHAMYVGAKRKGRNKVSVFSEEE